MNSPEEFQDLRRLLTLKRHEEPPPGYFNNFSDKVIARIEAEELAEHSSWWTWLVQRFDARPIMACAYGFAVTGLLLMGFRVSQVANAEMAGQGGGAGVGPWLANTPDPNTVAPNDFLLSNFRHPAGLLSMDSTPVFNRQTVAPQPFRFGGSRANEIQPASFSFSPSY